MNRDEQKLRDAFQWKLGGLKPSTSVETIRHSARRGRALTALATVLAVSIAGIGAYALTRTASNDQDRVVGPGPKSEDGLIAFVTQEPGEGSLWIAVVPVSGGEPTRLREGRDPAWSPDGTRIAFGCDRGICTMNPDGSEVVQLTDPVAPAYDEEPDWGPGGFIAFTRSYMDGSQGRDLLMVHQDGGRPTPLLEEEANFAPSWSPDGRALAFVRGIGPLLEAPEGGFQLWTMNADGTELTQLTDNSAARPDWSPDGRSILFDQEPALWTIPAEGGSPRRLPVHNGEGSQVDTFGSWAPDSRRFAFSCEHGICVSEIDSEERTVLVANGGSPAWQPVVLAPEDEQPEESTFGRYMFTNGGGFNRQGESIENTGVIEVNSSEGSICVESNVKGATSAHLRREDAEPWDSIVIFEIPTEYRSSMCARGLYGPSLQAVIDDPNEYLIEFTNKFTGETLTAPLEPMGEPDQVRSDAPHCVGDEICLSRSSGPAGVDVTASIPASGTGENGVHVIRTDRVEWWWGLEGDEWVDVVEGNPPRGTFILASTDEPQDGRLITSFIVPFGQDPGMHPIFAIDHGGGGASGTEIDFEVTEGYGCPTLLSPGPNAEYDADPVINAYIESRQPEETNGFNYHLERLDRPILGGPEGECNDETWQRSYQVEGSFVWKEGERPSASMSYFRFVVGRAEGGWVVWAVAH